MGYTHYWIGKKSTRENWNKFVEACKKLYANLPANTKSAGGYYENEPLEIAGGNGKGKPVFNNKTVCFNGKIGAKDLAYETFWIDKNVPDDLHTYCKTARKPYDLLVVACLIAAWQILDYRFSSDGFDDMNNSCDDLKEGYEYYNKVMQPDVPITEEMLWKQYKEYYLRVNQ
jgi:hypothetical protein